MATAQYCPFPLADILYPLSYHDSMSLVLIPDSSMPLFLDAMPDTLVYPPRVIYDDSQICISNPDYFRNRLQIPYVKSTEVILRIFVFSLKYNLLLT